MGCDSGAVPGRRDSSKVRTPSNDWRLCSRTNLPQEGSNIEINPSCRNLSGTEVIFVERAARDLNMSARCLDVCKRTLMDSFKVPFHCNQILSVG
jgi:hypothetical protein